MSLTILPLHILFLFLGCFVHPRSEGLWLLLLHLVFTNSVGITGSPALFSRESKMQWMEMGCCIWKNEEGKAVVKMYYMKKSLKTFN